MKMPPSRSDRPDPASALNRPVRVVAIMEASTVTGPAGNLLRFAARSRVASEIDDRLAEISIVTFVRGNLAPGQAENQFLKAARDSRILVDTIAESSRSDTAVISRLSRTLARIQPDIVQTHGVKSHFLLSLARRPPGTAWLAFHHGYTTENMRMRLYNQLDRWSLRKAKRVVTVCAPFAEQLVHLGVDRERIHVVPNTIERQQSPAAHDVAELRKGLGIPDGERVLLSVGRLSSEKGYLDLLRAVRLLADIAPLPPFRLVLLGDGVCRRQLEATAASLDIANRVLFCGHRDHPWPYYGLADVFVLPSHSEGSPNVLLEAMAAGVPIVATEVGGVGDMIRHGESGLLVPPHQPAQLSGQIAALLQDPLLADRLHRNAAEGLQVRFHPEQYRKTLLDIYNSVIAERGPGQ